MTDAHNHLQQLPDPAAALELASRKGVTRMVVNGTCEADWGQIRNLACLFPEQIIPAFGLHPWQVPSRSPHWQESLESHLAASPGAIIGECGLDRWKEPYDLDDQIDCLRAQLELARKLERPLTIHCLKAWGALRELLGDFSGMPPFLLHAYSGAEEMVGTFAEMGAYFSFNGYFLHERKANVREVFKTIPPERLLLETDAPSMKPPESFQHAECRDAVNHPANLPNFLPPLAELLETNEEELGSRLETNFEHFLGPVMG